MILTLFDRLRLGIVVAIAATVLGAWSMSVTDAEALPVGLTVVILVVVARFSGVYPLLDAGAAVVGSLAYADLERGQGTAGTEAWAAATLTFLGVLLVARLIDRTLAALAEQGREALETVDQLMLLDEESGLLRRQHGEQVLEEEVRRARRLRTHVTFLLAAADEDGESPVTAPVKEHEEATLIGAVFREVLRTTDRGIRMGPSAFGAILPDTDVDGGTVAAEKVMTRCQEDGTRPLRFAAVTFPESAVSALDLIREAEAALDLARTADLPLVTAQMLG